MTQPTLITLHPNEYSQEFHCYSFAVKLDRCVGSCNVVNSLSNKLCIPNKTENLNLSVFNMIAGINESKTSTEHISCKFKFRFDGRKCNVCNPYTRNCKNGKYLASIMDNSAIMCDKIIQSYEEETNFNEKKSNYSYILLAFLLITIALLIAVSISFYLIKFRANQKHLLPFRFTNNKLKNYKSKMSNKVKDIDIKNQTYYFSNDIVNIKNFDSNNIEKDEKSYKNIFI